MKIQNKVKLSTIVLVIATALLTSACSKAPEQEYVNKGNARVALFKECMELASKLPRQSDDGVSDVVKACSGEAWYMTRHIK